MPDGRPVPGTWAGDDELLAFGDVLRRTGRGLFEGAMRLGERDDDALTKTRAEVAVMGEISRRSGRPVSYGLVQSDRRPELYAQVIEFTKEENANGAHVRPQTTARGIGVIYNLFNRTPWDRAASWRELRGMSRAEKLAALRDPSMRARLVGDANEGRQMFEADKMFILPEGAARYDCQPTDSLAAHAARRGVSPVEAFLELCLERDGNVNLNVPILNHQLSAVEAMLDDKLVTLGLADAGAHVGPDHGHQSAHVLPHLLGARAAAVGAGGGRASADVGHRGPVRVRRPGSARDGAFADVNVIDFDNLTLPQPEYVNDLPNGAGRYVQGSSGYDYTIVNGEVFMDHGQHTGTLAGRLVRSS